MSKKPQIEKFQEIIIQNGIAHIVYYANNVQNIIHQFSVNGYELLSDEFIAFLEKYRVIIPRNTPIVLEITGCLVTEAEKELIEDAIWTHFCLNMTVAENNAKRCTKRCILYLLYTVITSVLLFAVQGLSDEIITNLAYILFWFFGYRVLIYLIIDCVPILKTKKWYNQLASMTIIFTEANSIPFDCIDYDKVFSENTKYQYEADTVIKNNKLAAEYFMDNGIIGLGCKVNSIRDIIQVPELTGREFMSSALADYLLQAEPFVNADLPITLDIEGTMFNDEEQGQIIRAVSNYYSFRIAIAEKDSHDNKQQILLFGLSVIISAVIIFVWGAKVNLAWHEFLLMTFYFFGDYLLEFILISHFDIKKAKKVLENCKRMNVRFK